MKNPSNLFLALALSLPAAAHADLNTGFDGASAGFMETATAGSTPAATFGKKSYTDLLANKIFLVDASANTVLMTDLTHPENSSRQPVSLTDTKNPAVVAYNEYLSRQQTRALTAAGLTNVSGGIPASASAGVLSPRFSMLSVNSSGAAGNPSAPGSKLGATPTASNNSSGNSVSPVNLAALSHNMGDSLTGGGTAPDPTRLGANIGAWMGSFGSGPTAAGTAVALANVPGGSRPATGADGSAVGSPLGFSPTFRGTQRTAGINARLAPKIESAAGLVDPNAVDAQPTADDGTADARAPFAATTNH